jgi:hypothetical protein
MKHTTTSWTLVLTPDFDAPQLWPVYRAHFTALSPSCDIIVYFGAEARAIAQKKLKLIRFYDEEKEHS